MPQAQQQQHSIQQQNGSQQGQAYLSMHRPAVQPVLGTRKRKAQDDDSDLFSLLPTHAPASSGIPQQASLINTALSEYDGAADSWTLHLIDLLASTTGSGCTCALM